MTKIEGIRMKHSGFILKIFLFFVLVSKTTSAQDVTIKISDDLELLKISENSYIHISYHDLENAPHFPANGLIYINNGKAIIIDTPWTDELTKTLTKWLKDSLEVIVEGVIVTHWHLSLIHI